jgi:lipoyl(octanoyl) transferase
MRRICRVHWLGTIPYQEAWDLQNRLAGEISAGVRPPSLLLLEHPHTYTFGRSGHAKNMLWDEAELTRRGITVHWVDRGGDVTYHGPGQLVGYPLLPLAPGGLRMTSGEGSPRLPMADYVGYIRNLEMVLIHALKVFGIQGEQIAGLTGVWVRRPLKRAVRRAGETEEIPEKIAAIGVKVDVKGISRHGFALNVNPDMSYWQGIIGCGLHDYAVTRLADFLDPVPSIKDVREAVIAAFGQVFDYEMREMDNLNLRQATRFDTPVKNQ